MAVAVGFILLMVQKSQGRALGTEVRKPFREFGSGWQCHASTGCPGIFFNEPWVGCFDVLMPKKHVCSGRQNTWASNFAEEAEVVGCLSRSV